MIQRTLVPHDLPRPRPAAPRVHDRVAAAAPPARGGPRRPRSRPAAFAGAVAPRHALRAITALAALAALACADAGSTATPREPVAAVAVAPAEHALLVGETATLTATPRGASGRPLEGRTVTWTTSDPAVVAVSLDGRIVAVAPGAAVVSAASEGTSGRAAVTVAARPPVPVARVEVAPTGLVLAQGDARQLVAVVRDAAGGVLSGRAVAWTTDDARVAAVSATGLVRAVGPGDATIVATSEGRSAGVAVTVTAPPVVDVDVSPRDAAIRVGERLQLTARPRGPGNVPLDRPVAWSSDDERVAVVDDAGRVVGRGPGVARVTATSEGVSRSAVVLVYTVREYRLLRVDGALLPRTLYTTVETGADGVVRQVRSDAHEGVFRLGFDGRYEQAVGVWIFRDGSPAVQGAYVYRGSWAYDVSTEGGLVFHPVGDHPAFRGRLLPDGTLAVTRRLKPGTPELTFLHAAP